MIKGIGLDAVEIGRIEKLIDDPRFLAKIYTEAERELIRASGQLAAQRAAGNFAVKEAVAKAFGCGLSGCPPRCVEVLRNEQGAPVVMLSGEAKRKMEDWGIAAIWVSITNTRELAVAQAILEQPLIQ
jgi:holo-[acyl-carrier protein] synthase